MSVDCDVAVVGAGPTGLMAANLLVRAGASVRVVEQRLGPTRQSRAFAIQARTLELLRSIGLADAFVAAGMRADSVNIHVRGHFRGGLDFARADTGDTPYPFILLLPQSETERLLADDCAGLGIEVERGRAVTSVAEDADGVTVSGEGWQLRARYVIGADGSHSVVRGAAGLAWNGDMLPQRFLLADCRVEWPLDHAHFRVFLHGPLVGLFLPLDGTRLSRVMATDTNDWSGAADATGAAPLDLAEMQRGFAAAVCLPVTLADPVWVTRYRAHHRFVDRYGRGRMFVAGDAAHIHSPAGGQGMNTGLQDAANLAWRLVAVLRGADARLLDGYDAERRPVGEAVMRGTGRLFAAAAGQAGWKAGVRDAAVAALLPLLSRARPFQTKAFRNASQRAVSYGGGWGEVGGRAPDVALRDGSVFDRLSGYCFHLLLISTDPASAGDRERAADFATETGVAAHLLDGEREAARRYGVSSAASVLVRPDGYVTWRGDGFDFAGAAAHLVPLETAA